MEKKKQHMLVRERPKEVQGESVFVSASHLVFQWGRYVEWMHGHVVETVVVFWPLSSPDKVGDLTHPGEAHCALTGTQRYTHMHT